MQIDCIYIGVCLCIWSMDHKRLTDDIIYKANVTSNLREYEEHIYFGSTEATCKKATEIAKNL